MKITKKIKILEKNGIKFGLVGDSDIIKVNVKESNLYLLDGKELSCDGVIECEICTKKELIEYEAETMLNCYFNVFEATLKERFKNSSELIDLFIGDDKEQEERAYKIAKSQIDDRTLTVYNCLTYGQSELIGDKLYLRVL